MVSPQNPTNIVSDIAAGRGFVPPAEETRAVSYQAGVLQRSYVGWGGVIAGMLLSISIFFLSASLAYACGVPAFTGREYGWGAGIWSVVTSAIAFYCGGCLAAYMAPSGYRLGNLIHGAAVWAISLLFISIFFAGTLFGHGGLLGANTALMTVDPTVHLATSTLTVAAWGSWLSLLVGLMGAALGGGSVLGRRERA